MAVFKCKMCGGTIEFAEGATVGICDSCGTKQTLPKVNDDAIGSLFNRANTLRMKSEFDRAEEIYNKIITADEAQAEAYWGIILCKFGIEYVEDPKTFKRVPTCHRASFDAISADEDFKLALQYGDAEQRKIYLQEAKAIDAIQKDILNIAKNEKPFDVFICYKETDENGKRTQDSVIANEIYHQLTLEGFKVFYSAITLEDKLGQEYEPYIFAALNSAKVMIVAGTKPEYFTAVWVKNEWSRFLKIMKADRSKLLIPCYKDMDAYELPDDFAHLQAQDMSKIGFINDVVRGIKKVLVKEDAAPIQPSVKETVVMQNENGNIQAFLDRGFMALEDGEWEKADGFFEQALNFDAKLARAYLGKLMTDLHVKTEDELKNYIHPFYGNSNCVKASRFDAELAEKLAEDNRIISERIKNSIYIEAVKKLKSARLQSEFEAAANIFGSISGYKDADQLKEECYEKVKTAIDDTVEAIKPIIDTVNRLSLQIKETENKLSHLGLFSMNEKRELKLRLDRLNKQLIEAENQKQKSLLSLPIKSQISLGSDTVWFGNYHNPIEWIVLKKENNKALLISRYALDCKEYNTENTDITWETCSLRKWMKSTFLNEAFNNNEQDIILETTIPSDIAAGNTITDKVFLLSKNEAEKYFTSNNNRKCEPTQYAIIANPSCVNSGNKKCNWWLRTPGSYQNYASFVFIDGSVFSTGYSVNTSLICVRPALWIEIQ